MSDTPEQGPAPTTESEALSFITKKLAPAADTPDGEGQSGGENVQTEGERPEGGEQEAAPQDQASEGEAEGEKSEDEAPQLPESIDDVAKAYGIEPEKLGNLKVKVKVDGQDLEVTLSEAVNGYSRQEDYSRKTEETARQRKEFEAVTNQAFESWQSRLSQADTLIQYMHDQLQLEADPATLDRLFETDREAYDRAKRSSEKKQAALQQVIAARRQAHQEMSKAQQDKVQQFREEQQKALLAKVPELRDPKKQSEFEEELTSTLETYGYSRKEVATFLAGPFDHKQVLLARDAMAYRKLRDAQSKAKPIAKAVPKLVKPGATRQSPDERTNVAEQAINRMRKNPTRENALERIKAIL